MVGQLESQSPNDSFVPGTLRDGLLIKSVPSYYTASQISQWLSYIGFPTKLNDAEISAGSFDHSLKNLEDLTRLHILAFPFENTPMHYTEDHTMDVSHEGAFRRLVLERKGSYCYGQNGVFLGMLRGLGYRAYSGAARVNMTAESLSQADFTSLSHMVIFVQPFEGSNITYLVDVGFGSSGLVRPILLSDSGDNTVMGTNPTERHRLTRSVHPQSSIETSNAFPQRSDFNWGLEVWHSKGKDIDSPWKLLYIFNEAECFPIDCENSSYFITAKPEGLLKDTILCIRYKLLTDAKLDNSGAEGLDAEASLELGEYPAEVSRNFMYKYVMVGRQVKRYIGGNFVIVRNFETELDRIKALREIFGLNISDDAAIHIEGRNSALASGLKLGNVLM